MLPLAEKTIVVTRAREQAGEFASALKKLGADVFLFPTIEIAPPESYADLDEAISNFADYDWLVFTSVNGVEHFLSRLGALNLEIADLDLLRVCAVGEATAERLRLAQIHLDIIPADSSAEGVFEELRNYVGDDFADLRFLLPRSEIAREILPQKLIEAGAIVRNPVAYRTVLPEFTDVSRLKSLLLVGSIDCVTFTSPSTFKNFAQIFGNSDLSILLKGVKIACIGETTARAIRESNLTVHIISEEATSSAFARAISEHL